MWSRQFVVVGLASSAMFAALAIIVFWFVLFSLGLRLDLIGGVLLNVTAYSAGVGIVIYPSCWFMMIQRGRDYSISRTLQTSEGELWCILLGYIRNPLSRFLLPWSYLVAYVLDRFGQARNFGICDPGRPNAFGSPFHGGNRCCYRSFCRHYSVRRNCDSDRIPASMAFAQSFRTRRRCGNAGDKVEWLDQRESRY